MTTQPGQAAHSLWLTTRWPDMSAQVIAGDWKLVSPEGKQAWAAVEQMPLRLQLARCETHPGQVHAQAFDGTARDCLRALADTAEGISQPGLAPT